ncbi:heavy metal translocating P-type ATPase [Hutsoniella sourekii]|uniref:heavy metal translocating P-type ATPase n=1 Tax=Hutsoniella sourekii TaxID=87650 RepID=UPI000558B5CB|nr:heavy metal translocating P-type ATPase [Hutsoniella sourekii]
MTLKNRLANFQVLASNRGRLRLEVPFICTPSVQAYLNRLSMDYPGIIRLQFYLNESRLTIHYQLGSRPEVLEFLQAINLADLERLYSDKKEFLMTNPGKIVTQQMLKRTVYLTLVPKPIRFYWTLYKAGLYGLEALKALRAGQVNMEVLDFAAVAAAIGLGDDHSAGTIMFILELGEQIDAWTLDKSIRDLTESLGQEQVLLWIEDKEGERRQIASDLIQVGDLVVVQEGQEIYFDGRVIKGQGASQESNLTGEPFPVAKTIGDQVYSNTSLEAGELVVEVTNATFNARLKDLVASIHESSQSQSANQYRLSHRADSLVKYNFLGMALTWLLTRNLTKALSFLLVDFSCAIKLSTSVTYLTAIRKAMDEGVVVKGSRFIDLYPEVDCFIFDKTGTLTESKLVINQVVPFGDHSYEEVLMIGACLEEHLYHPIAQAVVAKAADEGITHEEMHGPLVHIASRGVKSSIEEDEVLIGSEHFIKEEGIVLTAEQKDFIDQYRQQFNLLYLARAGELIAIFCIDTPLRDNALEVLNGLKQAGKEIVLLTGDVPERTLELQALIDFDQIKTQVTPQDKLDFIEAQQRAGKKVLMIGDGLNDSAAIAQADLGVVMADSSDLARQASDIIFLSDNLASLFDLGAVHQSLQDQLDHNLKMAVGINSSLIALGLLGLMPSSALATFHNLSTVLIVADSFKF